MPLSSCIKCVIPKFKIVWFGTSDITRGGGAGGRVPPQTSDREIFADVSGKKRQAKKGKGVKIEKKRSQNVKGKVEDWKRK